MNFDLLKIVDPCWPLWPQGSFAILRCFYQNKSKSKSMSLCHYFGGCLVGCHSIMSITLGKHGETWGDPGRPRGVLGKHGESMRRPGEGWGNPRETWGDPRKTWWDPGEILAIPRGTLEETFGDSVETLCRPGQTMGKHGDMGEPWDPKSIMTQNKVWPKFNIHPKSFMTQSKSWT